MRIVIHGVGAIGGLLAASFARSDQEVIGIARGAQLDAIRRDGLQVLGVEQSFNARFPVVAHPAEIAPRPDDVVLLCMKTQGTLAALEDLRNAGFEDQAIFCCQNGVANERMAARLFPDVHGITVMMPNVFVTPGVIGAQSHPRFGIFELGRYPGGYDQADETLAAALEKANVAACLMQDVMAGKYGKLLLNLTNILDAAVGRGNRDSELGNRIRDEARRVYKAAGIDPRDVGSSDPRRQQFMQIGKVEGIEPVGSSTAQSLARAAGGIETDWLNGEIVLLGRQHGVPTPANLAMTRLAARLIREERGPGQLSLAEVEALVAD